MGRCQVTESYYFSYNTQIDFDLRTRYTSKLCYQSYPKYQHVKSIVLILHSPFLKSFHRPIQLPYPLTNPSFDLFTTFLIDRELERRF